MASKICNHCHEEKDVSEFSWRYKDKGIRQPTCKVCQRKQHKAWYARHGKKHRKRVVENQQAIKNANKQWVWDYLSNHPCVDCGENDPMILEFDHVRGKKRNSISRLVGEGYGLETIQAEIAKCVVRCANCHRRKTYKEKGWFQG